MTRLSAFLSAHIARRALSQKEVAVAILERLEAQSPARTLELTTVTTKLSKLLGGHAEGTRFFFEDESRLGALARALDLDPERLSTLRAEPLLVLHPKLPAEAVAYLESRQEEAGFSLAPRTEVTIADEVLASLRDTARRAPASWVVLPDERDATFFAGADVKTSTLQRHTLGWILSAAPDVVPLPPPPPPRFWRSDSNPLFLCPALAEKARLEWERRKATPLYEYRPSRCEHDDALELGQQPTFTLAHLEDAHRAALAEHRIELHKNGHAPGGDAALATLLGTSTMTHVWSRGRRVFAVGPAVDRAREFLGAADCPHALETPSSFAEWRRAADSWNPWDVLPRRASNQATPPEWRTKPDRARWDQLLHAVGDESGVSIESACKHWWSVTLGAEAATTRARPAASQGARKALRQLSQRELEVQPADACLAFRLQEVAEAPLIELATAGRESFHVVANLGAGHLLHLRVFAYPEERPTALRGDRFLLVGGDVTVVMHEATDILLEACGLHAARRGANEASERLDDDDDD